MEEEDLGDVKKNEDDLRLHLKQALEKIRLAKRIPKVLPMIRESNEIQKGLLKKTFSKKQKNEKTKRSRSVKVPKNTVKFKEFNEKKNE